MAEPERGIPYEYYISLLDTVTGEFQIDPTIIAGDFRVSKDGGAFANLDTLPMAMPGGSASVKVNLSALEMTADKIVVEGHDFTTVPEWIDHMTFIDCPDKTPGGISKVLDILEGDHIETAARVIINRKDTLIPVLDKKIVGSLLKSNVTISTFEQP